MECDYYYWRSSFFFKLIIASKTYGSNDVRTWELFADIIKKIGGTGLYQNLSYFNHPPFIIHLLKIINLFESITKIGLPFWLRLFSSLADVGSLLVLYNFSKLNTGVKITLPSLILIAIAPVSIMVAGFHGNTDPIMIFLLLLSIYLIETDKDVVKWLPSQLQQYFTSYGLTNLCLAGMAYGIATNIKVIAFLAAPCIFFYLSDNKKRLEYTVTAAFTWVIAASPYIFLVPTQIIKNSFNYNSFYGFWGVSRILTSVFPSNHWLNIFYSAQSKFFIIAIITIAALFMSFIGKKVPLFIQIGLTFFIFLSLSSGFGVQYLSWLLPWVLGLGIEAALLYYIISGIFAFMLYNYWSSGFPWNNVYALPYDNFILHYEYTCWFTVITITVIYIIYIIKLKTTVLNKYFSSLWLKPAFSFLTIVVLITVPVMAYIDLFTKKGFYVYAVTGETREIRENKILEAIFISNSHFYSNAKFSQEALDSSNKVIELNPNNADAYNNMCYEYNALQEWEKAIDAGNKALKINPNYQLAQNNVNWAKSHLAATGKVSNELQDLISYLKVPPANFTSSNFTNISLQLIQNGDNYNAVIACEKAIELDPNNSIAYNNMCIAYNNILMFDEAEVACKKALEISPSFELAKNNYNFTLSRKGDKTAPKAGAGSLINLSLAFYNVRKFDKSIIFAKKALEIQPNNSIAYNNLCVAHIGLNQINEAIEAGEMAVKLDPNFSLAKANLDWAKSLKK